MRRILPGLFVKYAVLIAVLVGGMLVAATASSTWFAWRENRAQLVALQVAQADAASTRIGQYIVDIEHQLGWTALPSMAEGGPSIEQRRIEYLKLLRQVPAITDVAWIDAEGREQLRVSRLAMDTTGAGIDRSDAPAFRAVAAGRTYYGPVYFRKETEPYMTIARPAGEGKGATVAEVNLKFVWDVVSRIRVGAEGIAYVVDGDGTLIAHPDISRVLARTSAKDLPQFAARTRDSAGRDFAGSSVLSARADIPTLGWTVFVESPETEALAPLRASLLRAVLLLVAGLVVSTLASFFVARALVRPLRALEEGAARIGAGDLDRRIVVDTGDELERLAAQFNAMAAALQASHADLEAKVDARTRELSEALDRQTATADILQAIGSSVADAQPVFDRILAACERLFDGSHAVIDLLGDDDAWHLAAYNGPHRDALAACYPVALGDVAASDPEILARRVTHFPDVANTPDLPEPLRRGCAIIGCNALVMAPMLRGTDRVGTILVGRHTGAPFTAKETSLLQTFADQAVIAIRNAQLFAEIQDKSRQLEAADRHKSEFLANMSHELRTPLNAIIGFSEVLAEKMFGEVNDKQLEYLRDIHASGHHLLSLINDILDLSKIEAGRMELDLAPVDLATLLDQCRMLVRERAARHGLALETDFAAGLGEVVVDVRKTKQIVLNLLSNAVKFTPAGGRVVLGARRIADGVEIVVADTGVGIAPEDHERVFEAFRQAQGDYLRKAEGTGLGLPLAKRFVELHGGTLAVDSAPGRGSRFVVTLPARILEVA